MLNVNLLDDQGLSDVVNRFISALLPHENFDVGLFSNVLETLFRYIKLEEFKLEHRIVLTVLRDLERVRLSVTGFEPKLERDTLQEILEASIMETIVSKDMGIREWLTYEGLQTDISIESVKETACQRLCARTLDLYDECMMLAQDTTSVLNYEPALKEAFVAHVSVQCLNTQSEILRHKSYVGRKLYQGSLDWLEYTISATAEVDRRLKEAKADNVICLDSVEGSYKLLKQIGELLVPIAKWGIPELDDVTPILQHRLVVVVGQENIGKTKFAIDKATNVLLEGKSVVYMCGESHKARVYADILKNYIWKKTGFMVKDEHLAAPQFCPEDIRKEIGIAVDEINSKSGLVLSDSFNYNTVYQELCALYEKTNFDMVVIDHSAALTGSVGDGSMKSKIDALALACRDFKKTFPVCVLVTSHPSSAGKENAKRDRNANDSLTGGSSTLSKEADELFYLRDNEALAKQNLLILENAKRRDAGKIENIILQKQFEVSALIYNPKSVNVQQIDREEALSGLDAALGINDERWGN